MSVELGDLVEHTRTGFRGIAVMRYEYLDCSNRVLVQPHTDVSFILPESQAFEESALEVVTPVKQVTLKRV